MRSFTPSLGRNQNFGLSFNGCYAFGKGFVVEPTEAQQWIAADPVNADVLIIRRRGYKPMRDSDFSVANARGVASLLLIEAIGRISRPHQNC